MFAACSPKGFSLEMQFGYTLVSHIPLNDFNCLSLSTVKITASFAALFFGDTDKEIIETGVHGPGLHSPAAGRRSCMEDSGVKPA